MPDGAIRLLVALAEQLQCLVLRRRGEGEVARVPQQPTRLHDAVDPVLVGLVLLDPSRLGECTRHRRRRLAALTGVCLVDDDREATVPLAVSDLVQDEWELLHRRDDDLLPGLDEPLEIARPVRLAHRGPDLRVLADRVADLPVQNAAVGHYDDGVEHRRASALQPEQLMREPRDGVALAAAGRVLDQIAPAHAALARIVQQPTHHIELMVAWPDLCLPLPAGLLVPDHDDLGVVLEDVRHAFPGQHLAPQVVGLDSVRVRRISRAVVPAAVEREEPRVAAGQVRAETRLVLVDRKVGHAPPELEEPLAGTAILAVLADSVVHGLFREAVLQLEGEDRQTVDEERDVQRALGLVAAVAQLPSHGEAVLVETLAGRLVALRGTAVEQLEVVWAVADPVAQHVDGAPLADLAL